MDAKSDGGPGPLGSNSVFSPVIFRLMPSHDVNEDGPQQFRFPHVSGAVGIQFFQRRLNLLLGDGRQPQPFESVDQLRMSLGSRVTKWTRGS